MAAMGPFMALASSVSCAMTTTCALDARLRASTLTTIWSVSPIPSPTVHGDSRTPGLTVLEGDILAMGGGARGATTDLVTAVVIIMDLDIITPNIMAAMDLAQAVLLVVLGVDSVEEVAAIQGEHSVAVGVAEAVALHGGGEVQLRRKLDSSSRLVLVAEQLNPWRLELTLNSSSNNSPSHPVRRKEGASFMELDKLCPVFWSRLV